MGIGQLDAACAAMVHLAQHAQKARRPYQGFIRKSARPLSNRRGVGRFSAAGNNEATIVGLIVCLSFENVFKKHGDTPTPD